MGKRTVLKNEDYVKYETGYETESNDYSMVNVRIKLTGEKVPSVSIMGLSDLEDYFVPLLSDCASEEFHVLCVDNQCKVLAHACVSMGDIGSCNADPAKIARIALLSNASGVFLAHNHPGGTAHPSVDDFSSTTLIGRALKMFDIKILDHLIVTQFNGCYSFSRNHDPLV